MTEPCKYCEAPEEHELDQAEDELLKQATARSLALDEIIKLADSAHLTSCLLGVRVRETLRNHEMLTLEDTTWLTL